MPPLLPASPPAFASHDVVPPLRAQLLGPARVTLGERVLTDEQWPRLTARSLMLLLLSSPGHRLPRDRVLDTLWPEASPESGLNALYSALHALRRVLDSSGRPGRESAYVEARGGSIGLRDVPGMYVDVEAFTLAIARARSIPGAHRASALREAVALYGGDFLADEPYADWPVAMRERLRLDWRRAVLDLAELEREGGRPLAALQPLEMLLATDGTDEAVHRALMEAQAAGGRRDEALRQYARCIRVLSEELDATPSDETRMLAEAIEASAPQAVPATRPPLRLPPLPAPQSRFIGRSTDVAGLRELIGQDGVRLITVVGPGGVGKTRLALEVARLAAGSFEDGIAFVALASIRDRALLLPTIARALGLAETPSRSATEQVHDALYDRELLLVLDNLEQLIDGAHEIAALIDAHPAVRVLATSREPLNLRVEQRYVLEPLSVADVSDAGRAASPEDLASIAEEEAIALFVDRARAVKPGFQLSVGNARFIAAICARLEGLPLALELAASRCRYLAPPELLQRLERRLPLLTGGPRDAPARLQTMRDAISWSHDLLGEAEKRAFRRLAVMAGGCTLEAAEALVSAPPDSPSEGGATALDLIGSLADKSLLRLEGTAQTRLAMLETIREFGLEELAATGQDGSVRAAHAALYLDMAEQAAPALIGRDQQVWLERLEADHDNIRQAYDTFLAEADSERALRLCRALSRFWRMHGHYVEGRSRVERALALGGPRSITRARALSTAADLAEAQGDFDAAEPRYREALAISREQADERGLAEASMGLGAVALGRSELPVGAEWVGRALELFRKVGDPRGTAGALNYLAAIHFHRGELDAAAPLWHESIALVTELGDYRARAMGLSNLGVLELQRGRPEDAAARQREALDITRRLQDPFGSTAPLLNLGRVLVLLRHWPEATAALEEALANCRQLGDAVRAATSLQLLGGAALAQGNVEEAATHLASSLDLSRRSQSRIITAGTLDEVAGLMSARGWLLGTARILGAVASLLEDLGAVRETVDEPAYERTVAAARAALDPDAFAQAWSEGRDLSPDDAIDEALSFLATVH